MFIFICFYLLNVIIIINNNIISFTLYPAHCSVGRENLVLRHSVPHFLPNSGDIVWWVAKLNVALNLDTRARNGNINVSKYFISSSGDRTHNQLVLQSHFTSSLFFNYFFYNRLKIVSYAFYPRNKATAHIH